jgi:hypothetical protein
MSPGTTRSRLAAAVAHARRAARPGLLLAISFAACGACGESSAPPSAPGEAPAPRKAELDRASAAAPEAVDFGPVLGRLGLDSADFEPSAARPYAAIGCVRGESDGLDLLLCRYADGAQAEAAMSTLRDFVVGALSGLVRVAGSDALAIADRKQVDPTGERISSLEASFSR